MTISRQFTCVAALTLWLSGICAVPVRAQNAPPSENAVWLPDYNVLKNVPDVLAHMQSNGVRYLLPIDGALLASGKYGGSPGFATGYMNDIQEYETRTGYKFKVLLFMVGDLTRTKPKYVNISDPAIRAAVAAECAKFTSRSVPGSFVAGAKRTFDGVVLDLEPGGVYHTAQPFQELGKAVRGAIGSDKSVGFYTPMFGAKAGDWQWDASEYYDLAASGAADYLMAATYGRQSTSEVYQAQMREQVTDILRAVSGTAFHDARHPAPTTGVKVFIGFPAYKNNHMIADAGIATRAALANLDAVSASFLKGAHVFTQTNGDGADGNASYTEDWPKFKRFWLGEAAAASVAQSARAHPSRENVTMK